MEKLSFAIAFRPNLHSKIWGGDAIKDYKNIDTRQESVGESWEVSAVPGAESEVASGPLAGLTLSVLAERYGAALLGGRVYGRYGGKFPLLVKIIDANDDLSVQVHPGDALAQQRHGSAGKTEMWYVIATRPGARIHIGLDRRLDPDSLEVAAADGTVGDYIASYESHPGDSFFIPAGRVHAIGAGNLLAEIQQSSDITYRIFDYNRRDSEGNLRELHIPLAKDAVDYTILPDYRNNPRRVAPGHDEIADCDYFRVDRFDLDGELLLEADADTFRVVMCIDGEAELSPRDGGDGAPVALRRGTTLLIPACAPALLLRGNALLLTAQA